MFGGGSAAAGCTELVRRTPLANSSDPDGSVEADRAPPDPSAEKGPAGQQGQIRVRILRANDCLPDVFSLMLYFRANLGCIIAQALRTTGPQRAFHSAPPPGRVGDAGRDLPAASARSGDAGRDTPARGCAAPAAAAGTCRRTLLMSTNFSPADASSASVMLARSLGSSTPSFPSACTNFPSFCAAPARNIKNVESLRWPLFSGTDRQFW